jgi:AraC-like DNA-binding protein
VRKNIKIGFSEIGGIYIGEDIQTEQHLHHAITIAVSFSEKFHFESGQQSVFCSGIIIQPNAIRKFINPYKSYVAFIHIDPFCSQGFNLTDKSETFKELSPAQTQNILEILRNWFSVNENNEKLTEELIVQIAAKIGIISNTVKMDSRIVQAIDLIRKSEKSTLKHVAASNNLSTYRLSHLFKEQTGMSFREFVLYSKLIKSLKAICDNQNFTQSSYSGGFSDQAHFTRTYFKAFGILPSRSVK